MKSMFLGDASKGIEVCSSLERGDWKMAEANLWNMDTAARDWVYEFIEQVAGNGFAEIARTLK